MQCIFAIILLRYTFFNKLSTQSYTVKFIIHYYNYYSSPVYTCFLMHRNSLMTCDVHLRLVHSFLPSLSLSTSALFSLPSPSLFFLPPHLFLPHYISPLITPFSSLSPHSTSLLPSPSSHLPLSNFHLPPLQAPDLVFSILLPSYLLPLSFPSPLPYSSLLSSHLTPPLSFFLVPSHLVIMHKPNRA